MSSPRGQHNTATDDPSGRAPLTSWYAQGFADGFGDRLLMFDNGATGPLELLRVRPDFALIPDFEASVRACVEQLTSFGHSGFAQARAVNHLDNGEGLTIVSAHVPGTRLSELFQSGRSSAGMHPASVRWMLGELLSALAGLHRCDGAIAHGALSADRVVITSDRHLVVTDYVFGDALERLRLPAERLWTEFGLVPVPGRQPGTLDQRSDVVQAAVLVLSLVLGRRIAATEFPDQATQLLDEFSDECTRRAPDVEPALRTWLERAVHPAGFRSGADAERAWIQPTSLPAALVTAEAPAPIVPEVAPVAVTPVTVTPPAPPEPRPAAPVQAERPAAVAPVVASSVLAPSVIQIDDLAPARPSTFGDEPEAGVRGRDRGSVWLWVVAVLAAVAILQAAFILRILSQGVGTMPIQLTIDSAVAGDRVLVDGREVGVTPLALPLETVKGPIQVLPQTPAPGAGAVLATSGTLKPAPAAAKPQPPSTGGIRIVSPIPLQVVEGEKVLGSSANGPVFFSPGVHQLDLSNNALGFKTRSTVRVTSGRIVPLAIAPPNGSLNINAQPWAQVFIDGRPVGETPLANLSLPPGEHDVLFRHPQFGERHQKAVVQAGSPTRVSVSFTQP